ncbi:MAG: DUF1080 domain-containing protein [Puniceicoccaceae bacterium]
MTPITRFISLLLTTILLSSIAIAAQEVPEGWTSLFNGKNLDGWHVNCLQADKGKTYWKVVDGTIECDSMGKPDHDYVWLTTDKEYDNFMLTLQFQAFEESTGNSGVQVRSRYDASPDAPRGGWLDGPQLDVHPGNPMRIGKIYDETRSERRWISPSLPDSKYVAPADQKPVKFRFAGNGNGWNTLRIRCKGTRIQTWLNGQMVTDYDGSGLLNDDAHKLYKVGMQGHIALQLHSKDELRIRFRNIRIKELP